MSIIEEILSDALALDLPTAPRAQGRKVEVHLAFRRDLNAGDLAALATGSLGSGAPAVLKLRHSHHALARLIAEGKENVEAAAITGYTPGRVSILKADPAFQELVAYYKNQVEELFIDFHERLRNLGFDSIEELSDRLENDPKSFRNNEIMELVKLASDRTGHGPSARVQHTHTHFSDEVLDRLKAEAAVRSRSSVKELPHLTGGGRTIEGTVVEVSSIPGSEAA